ncbi:uncharacterized protein LOC142345127 [Convolutriloba macropyga]|uniref:uncharacterized protein LOC142345127 n=1 Tax=Convolutriloba macropyga TaxID=536237 RepID=UPI003F527AA6
MYSNYFLKYPIIFIYFTPILFLILSPSPVSCSPRELCVTSEGTQLCQVGAKCEQDERRDHSFFCGCQEHTFGNGVDQCSQTDSSLIPMKSDRDMVGCYTLDRGDLSRVFNQQSAADYEHTDLDLRTCADACLRIGFNFMYLAEGRICLCGNGQEMSSMQEVNNTNCDAPCSGYSSEMCGGFSRHSNFTECDVCATDMYFTVLTAQTSNVEYLAVDIIADLDSYGGYSFIYSDTKFNLHADLRLSINDMHGQEYCRLSLEGLQYSTMRKCKFDEIQIPMPGTFLIQMTVLGVEEKTSSTGLTVKERYSSIGSYLTCPPNHFR